MSGIQNTDIDVVYGCDEAIPGNCEGSELGVCGGHPHEHICEYDEFHDGPHQCCCGRIWSPCTGRTSHDRVG